MKVARITETYYLDVKRSLKNKWRWTRFTKRHIEEIAELHGISLKTVIQIKNSATYQDYVDQSKAQHGEVKHSLRDLIMELHQLEYQKPGKTYVKPKQARIAMLQILGKRNLELTPKGMVDIDDGNDMWDER